jgi:hypothetical protein
LIDCNWSAARRGIAARVLPDHVVQRGLGSIGMAFAVLAHAQLQQAAGRLVVGRIAIDQRPELASASGKLCVT